MRPNKASVLFCILGREQPRLEAMRRLAGFFFSCRDDIAETVCRNQIASRRQLRLTVMTSNFLPPTRSLGS